MQPKTPKKVTSPNNIQEKRIQFKKTQNVIKTNLTKFTRQTDTKQTNKKVIKNPLIVPNLNLKTSPTKLLPNPKEHKKLLTRVQTVETKIPLTQYRNSDQQIANLQTQFRYPPTSNRNGFSPMHSILKSKMSKSNSNSIVSSTDKEQLLLLEIKQLKRQNTFLKKKIRDLKKQVNGGFLPQQYENSQFQSKNLESKKLKKKGAAKLRSQSIHLTVNLFFEEIRNVLNSVTHLFRIQLSEEEVQKFQSIHGQQEIDELNEDICPLRKHEILKKYYLNRKLERLGLQEDEKKYEVLLNIFTEYYTFKEQSEKKVVETIDRMVMYMNDLNSWLIEKAYAKKMKSQIYSQVHTERQFFPVSPPKFQSLKVPPPNIVNYVTKPRNATLSPMPKSKQTQ